MKPKKANEIFVEVENQDDNQVLTTTKNILYDACSGSSGGTGNGILKKRKMTQKIIPENDLIEIVIDSSNHSELYISEKKTQHLLLNFYVYFFPRFRSQCK